jgi:hypothetical protein
VPFERFCLVDLARAQQVHYPTLPHSHGETEGAVVRGQEMSCGIEAGRRKVPRHRVGVPGPEESTSFGDSDGVQVAQVVRPAGGEELGFNAAGASPA